MKNFFLNSLQYLAKVLLVAVAVFAAILSSAPASFYLVQAKEGNVASEVDIAKATFHSPLAVYNSSSFGQGYIYRWQPVPKTANYLVAVLGEGQFKLFGVAKTKQVCQENECFVGQKNSLTLGENYRYFVLALPERSLPVLFAAQFTP